MSQRIVSSHELKSEKSLSPTADFSVNLPGCRPELPAKVVKK